MNSRSFILSILLIFAFLVLAVYALIVLVDPYSNIAFSLPLDRAPISTNQRFAYPTIARDQRYDSAVIGSSTMRLLNPDRLDRMLDANFANLAMNSATAYEQMRMHALFSLHHPQTKYLIIGIDDSWCKREQHYEKFTFREFPEWMFDENPWNDLLYMFNDKALENTVRLLELIGDQREPKYEKNGYRDFTGGFGIYDPTAIEKRFYPKGRTSARGPGQLAPSNLRPDWRFATHSLLASMLALEATSPKHTALVFAPMHAAYLARAEGLYRECKDRIVKLGRTHGVRIIDFMIESDITKLDDNYWDPLHYRSAVAEIIEADIANELKEPKSSSNRYLTY
ncbi:MAG: hypothetical protein ACI9BW_003265 [Gammaproteobacteria bacterium]|jgi:hypothetical protein